MQAIRDLEQKEAMEDLFFGQVAIIWARWFLILTGGLLILWNATDMTMLTFGVLPVALLMGMNFYLHGRYLMEKPVGAKLVLLTSVLDVVIITLLLVATPHPLGPLFSPYFVFYYPMVLAFALVMPRKIEIGYTVFVCVAFGVISLASIMTYSGYIPAIVDGLPVVVDGEVRPASALTEFQSELKLLTLKLITLAAMGGLGNYYFRIMRRRRAGEAFAAA